MRKVVLALYPRPGKIIVLFSILHCPSGYLFSKYGARRKENSSAGEVPSQIGGMDPHPQSTAAEGTTNCHLSALNYTLKSSQDWFRITTLELFWIRCK
jgi:hypothetical protein